jgi:riboflavin kinase/FMN adenylyltransferase
MEGVYATRTRIDDQWLDSVSFLGHRVTTDDSFAVETHILDQEIAEMSGEIALEFVDFIRINRKFDTLDALREQIFEDIKVAKKRLS